MYKYYDLSEHRPNIDQRVKLYFRYHPYDKYVNIGVFTYHGIHTSGNLIFKPQKITRPDFINKESDSHSIYHIPLEKSHQYQFVSDPKLNIIQKWFGRYYLGIPVLLFIVWILYKILSK